MPPLAVERLKAVAQHHATKRHTVVVLFLRDAPIIGVRQLAEKVKRPSHIELCARRHIQQRQIDGTATAVTGTTGNIALFEQIWVFRSDIFRWWF